MSSNLDEAMEFEDITKEEATREILKHNLNPNDFIKEIGHKDFYSGQEVLGWLGY